MLYSLLIGFLIGALAKWIMPGADPGDKKGFLGFIITILIGMAGSFVGNRLAAILGLSAHGPLATILLGIGGALLLLWIYRKVRK